MKTNKKEIAYTIKVARFDCNNRWSIELDELIDTLIKAKLDLEQYELIKVRCTLSKEYSSFSDDETFGMELFINRYETEEEYTKRCLSEKEVKLSESERKKRLKQGEKERDMLTANKFNISYDDFIKIKKAITGK